MAAAGLFIGHQSLEIHWAILILLAGTVFLMANQKISFWEGIFLAIVLGIGNSLMKSILFLDWTQVALIFSIASFLVHMKRTWLP